MMSDSLVEADTACFYNTGPSALKQLWVCAKAEDLRSERLPVVSTTV